jgi:hypothetical protein
MSEDRIDFSSLDIGNDPEKFERMVGNITWRARMELTRRAARQTSPIEALATWFRPAIASAAAIAAISLTLLATLGRGEQEFEPRSYMPSTEVPVAMVDWYEDGQLPTADDLLVVAGEGGR